jgi:hypothetical protein
VTQRLNGAPFAKPAKAPFAQPATEQLQAQTFSQYASKAKIQLPPNRQVRDSSLRNKWPEDGVSRIIAIITLEERPISKSGLIIKVVAIGLHLELLISYFGHSPASLKTFLQADTEKKVF